MYFANKLFSPTLWINFLEVIEQSVADLEASPWPTTCISLLFFSWADRAIELMHTFMDKAITLYWNTLYLNQPLISLERNFLVTYWLCTSGYVSSTCLCSTHETCQIALILLPPDLGELKLWRQNSSTAPLQDPPFPLASLEVYQTLC